MAGLIVVGLVIDSRRHQRQAPDPPRSERIEVLGTLAVGLNQALAPGLANALTLVSAVRPLAATLRQPPDALTPWALSGLADRMDAGLGAACHALDQAGHVLERLRDIGATPHAFPSRLFDLDELVLAVAEMVRPRFRAGPFQLNVEAGARAHLEGPPDVLRQILEELLDNAVRHGLGERPLGEVVLRSAPGPGGTVVVSVADDGAGMPPDVEARAFEPFFSTQPGALGVGLCVVEALTLQRLGGRVAVVSSPGEGTRVTLTLPRRAPEADPPRNKEPA
ncbi:sensor histidine kinase [Pararhodospirillum photometricum]|uniref:sensor histidine kinase n=1 Tax=Pararhodospirillum photometricum TaxID=1084 RepID=UPI0002EF41AC|nr:HAMP domain-containing sensor histidine kinase [Pararhodospirillum photometricum]